MFFLYTEPHLMCLLKQFHSLLEDLTVIFSAFSQHLPSQFLYSSSKFFLLLFTQQLSKLYHCFLLQSIVKRSLKLLDSLSNSITKYWKGIQSGQNHLFVSVHILNQQNQLELIDNNYTMYFSQMQHTTFNASNLMITNSSI